MNAMQVRGVDRSELQPGGSPAAKYTFGFCMILYDGSLFVPGCPSLRLRVMLAKPDCWTVVPFAIPSR